MNNKIIWFLAGLAAGYWLFAANGLSTLQGSMGGHGGGGGYYRGSY